MKFMRYFLVSLLVGLFSLLYNFLVFKLFDFYPGLAFGSEYFQASLFVSYLVIFLRGFLVGFVLMFLFGVAYTSLTKHFGRAILFFVLYAVVAFVVFSFGDMWLFGSQEGLLVLLSVDGFVEMMIATLPIRFFGLQRGIDHVQ